MATGLFTLKQANQAIRQGVWNLPSNLTYAGAFNGSNQFLSLPSISAYTLNADFTIEFWANATSYPSTGGGSPCVLSSTNTSNNWLVLVDSGTIAFYWNGGAVLSVSPTNVVGTWFHVAVVRSGSTVTIYKNGVSLGTATNSSSFTSTSTMFIGQQNTGVGYWAGSLSNVRVVKGTAVYTSTFLPPTAPLTAITNTSLLTLQNATIIDNSTNAATITNSNSVATSLQMPFTQNKTSAVDYLVVAGGGGGGLGGGGAGGLLQGIVPVTAGSSITVTVGAGGNGADGSNSVFGNILSKGGIDNTTGRTGGSGGGAYFNNPSGVGQGTAGQGNAGASGSSSGGSGGGGGGAGTLGIAGTNINTGGNGGGGVASAISGTVTAYAGGGGGYGSSTAGTGGAGGGGTGPTAGANGTAGTANTGGGGGGATGGSNLSGGSGIVIVSYPDTFSGAIATTGSPTVSTSGSGSVSFSGSSQYLISGTSSNFSLGTSDFSVECWVYKTSTVGDQVAVASSVTGSLDPLFFYFRDGGNAAILYLSSNGSSFDIASAVAVGTVSLNTWAHLAVTRVGTTFTTYLNGAQTSTFTSAASIYKSVNSYAIGAGQTSINAFKGYVSNVRVVKGSSAYSGAFTPSTTPLTPITNTVLLVNTVSGAYLADASSSATTFTNTGSVAWSQLSPFATGLGYKNRVYTWTSSGSITF
jgi:hypothetical protein